MFNLNFTICHIDSWGMKLTKICEPSLVLGVVSLIISLLIPIAIMLLDSKVSENASEDRWARKVLKKQIIHFDNILNYIIFIGLCQQLIYTKKASEIKKSFRKLLLFILLPRHLREAFQPLSVLLGVPPPF